MAKIKSPLFQTLSFAILAAILIATGCASVQQPGGGPKDTTPPKILEEKPANLTRNFKGKKIEIVFDEFIKLSNEYKEISISPSMSRRPEFKIKKNVLEINFSDSLETNTTYTINFGKSLVDYNEGNILKNYSYVFSTGNVIDSLTISGSVLNTLTKKPDLDVSVFLIPLSQDSIFGKRAANIITSTDSAGNFQFKNLRSDIYNIYALKEQSGDKIYNSITEEIAFAKEPLNLKTNITDVKLVTFKENPKQISISERRIEPDGRILLVNNQPLDQASVKILSPPDLDNKKEIEINNRGDSIWLYLPELAFDSINVELSNQAVPLDTVTIRRNRRDTYTRALNVTDNVINSGLSPQTGLNITLSAPVLSFDPGKITVLDDSISLKNLRIAKDSLSRRRYKITYPWLAGHTYTVRLEESAFKGAYGNSKYHTSKFKLLGDNLYGDLELNLSIADTANYIVQLLKEDGSESNQGYLKTSGSLVYKRIPVGRYRVRVIYDDNNNRKWDTGNVSRRTQPEDVWNYEKVINLRPNFELTEGPIIVPPR